MTTRDVYRRHRDDKRHAGRCRGLVSKLFRAVPRGALRNLPLTGPDGAKPAMSLALDDLDAEIRVMQAEKVERQQQQVCEAMDQVGRANRPPVRRPRAVTDAASAGPARPRSVRLPPHAVAVQPGASFGNRRALFVWCLLRSPIASRI